MRSSSGIDGQLDAASRRTDGFSLCLTGAFLIVCAIVSFHHAMWRDELQAWLLARDNASLSSLFHALKYEGHQSAWYLMLYVLTRFTHAPVAMQALHVVIAGAAAYVVARFAPFTRWQKVLLVFGYFPLYEYGVITRNYGLGMLLVFVLCAAWRTQWRRPLIVALILAAMSHVNIYSFIIALAFCMMAAVRFVFDRDFRQALTSKPVQLLAGAVLVVGAMGLAAWELQPPADSEYAVGWHFWPAADELPAGTSFAKATEYAAQKIAASVGTVWRAYVPIPSKPIEFWNTNIFPNKSNWVIFQPPLAAALILWAIWKMRRQRWSLLFYLIGTVALVTFRYAKFFGYTRHHGAYFIVLLAALWLADDEVAAPRGPASMSRFFTALLAVQAAVGIYACAVDLAVPFSAGRQAAAFLKREDLAGLPIVGHRDETTAGLSGWLDRPIYMADSGFRLGSYIRWSSERRPVTVDEVLAFARNMAHQKHQKVIVVLAPELSAPKSDAILSGPDVHELAHFDRTIVPDERFWIYLVSP